MVRYLVIELNGDWIEQEKNKALIEMYLNGTHFKKDIEFVDPIHSGVFRGVSKEALQESNGSILHFVKREMAIELAESLLRSGAIKFTEVDRDGYIRIDGSLVALPSGEKEEE